MGSDLGITRILKHRRAWQWDGIPYDENSKLIGVCFTDCVQIREGDEDEQQS